MDDFRTMLRAAWSRTQADDLVLTQDAAEKVSREASVRLLKRLCALALDGKGSDEQTLAAIRALCVQARLFFREQGI